MTRADRQCGGHLVVGDVHGCLRALQALSAAPAVGEREMVMVGDLVAKGPDSLGVVRYCRKRGIRAVRGNHDSHALGWRARVRLEPGLAPPDPSYLRFTEEDWQWLGALPFWLELPCCHTVVVHGGVMPGIPLGEQDPFLLMNLRSICPDGTGSKVIEDGVPWASRWSGPEHVVFGHDAIRGLQPYEHATGLDTGCVYGGPLTGLLLPERQLVQVGEPRV